MRAAILLLGVAVHPAGAAQRPPDDIRIELAAGSRLEREGHDQLRRILATYDLSPWMTRRMGIQSRAIPHSHPVLTLNTRYLDNDTLQAARDENSTYLHLLVCTLELDAVSEQIRAVLRARGLDVRAGA